MSPNTPNQANSTPSSFPNKSDPVMVEINAEFRSSARKQRKSTRKESRKSVVQADYTTGTDVVDFAMLWSNVTRESPMVVCRDT